MEYWPWSSETPQQLQWSIFAPVVPIPPTPPQSPFQMLDRKEWVREPLQCEDVFCRLPSTCDVIRQKGKRQINISTINWPLLAKNPPETCNIIYLSDRLSKSPQNRQTLSVQLNSSGFSCCHVHTNHTGLPLDILTTLSTIRWFSRNGGKLPFDKRKF